MRNTLLFLFISFITVQAVAQSVFSNSSPKTNWQYIENEKYRLIFPKSFENRAPQIASLLDTLYFLGSNSMLDKGPKKVSMIIRNESAISNGFVTLGPRRSEIYTMPPHDYNFLGTNDWLDKVIIHEYRHVVQFDHSNRGFNRLLGVLFGQSARAGMAFVSAPQWFWEGDAVLAETVFTRSGRGRIPGYNRVFRSNLLAGNNFKYEKQLLGSYKDKIPSHYILGTHLIPYVRSASDDFEIWEKVTKESFSKSFMPFAFSSSLKKKTGSHVRPTYDKMMSDLGKEWKSEIDNLELTSFEKVQSMQKKVFTDYNFPHPMEDGSVLVMKKGMADIERFVLLDSADEKKVFVPGIVNNTGMISVKNNTILWTEFNFHPRWRTESYSVIKLFDLSTKKLRQVKFKSRYIGADLSDNGLLIATTETDLAYKHSIVILDLSGNIIKRFVNRDNSHYTHIRFADSDHIIGVKTNTEGKSIVKININSEQETVILESGLENVGNPISSGEYVLFSSSITGIDNLFAINTSSRKRYQITESKYGAYYPMVSTDGKSIYYNEAGDMGLDVARIDFNIDSWKEVSDLKWTEGSLFKKSVEQEGVVLSSNILTPSSENVKRYGPIKGLLNIHSWGPFVTSSIDNFDIGIFSRDVLSTMSLFAGYNYDIDEQTGKYKGSISYQRFTPIFDIEVSTGNRSIDRVINVADQNDPPDIRGVNFTWQENEINLGTRIPLLLTRSKFLTSMEIGYQYSYTGVSQFGNNLNSSSSRYFYDLIGDGEIHSNTWNFFIFNSLKASQRDVKTRFGQFVSFENTGSFRGDYDAGQTSIRTRWYFPGIGKHHSLSSYWSYQNRKITLESDNYFLRNGIDLPRGVSVSVFENFYSMGVNYELPILYPDLAIGPLLYIKRLRLTGFFDYGYGVTDIPEANNFFNSREYYSTGLEMRMDFNVARILPQINMGMRYSYDLNLNKGMIEIIFPTIDL